MATLDCTRHVQTAACPDYVPNEEAVDDSGKQHVYDAAVDETHNDKENDAEGHNVRTGEHPRPSRELKCGRHSFSQAVRPRAARGDDPAATTCM